MKQRVNGPNGTKFLLARKLFFLLKTVNYTALIPNIDQIPTSTSKYWVLVKNKEYIYI